MTSAFDIDREAIAVALFAVLVAGVGTVFKTKTRRWKSLWDEQGANGAVGQRVVDVPMMIQQDRIEEVGWGGRGVGPIRKLEIPIEVYSKIPSTGSMAPGVPNKTTPGTQVINPLIDAVEQAVLGQADRSTGRVTLGGLVYDCRVERALIRAIGDEDPSGICGAIIPVIITVP